MSTLSISPAFDVSSTMTTRHLSAVPSSRPGVGTPGVGTPGAGSPAGRVRLTRRGRTVAVLTFLALALAVMTAMSGWAVASLSGGTPEPVRMVEVHPGDTLYGIAGEVAEPGKIRETVHRIQELNSLPGAEISVGQRLAVPRG